MLATPQPSSLPPPASSKMASSPPAIHPDAHLGTGRARDFREDKVKNVRPELNGEATG